MNIDVFMYLEKVRRITNRFPGTIEKSCYGTPGFYAEKNFFARIKEDGETIALYNNDRNAWIAANPYVYFITSHYFNSPMLLIRLSGVQEDDLHTLLLKAWQMRASKRLQKAYKQQEIPI